MSEKSELNFEEALKRLETIVSELEKESVSLEKSIALYEEGITLSRICTKKLEEAELSIEKVQERNAESNE